MNSLGLVWGRPSPALLAKELDAATMRAVTYDHVGSTIEPERWPLRTNHSRSITIGHGQAMFEAACEGLRRWECHRGIGAFVVPDSAPLTLGTTLLVTLRLGPVSIIVPDRIVAVVDVTTQSAEGTHRTFGFAYGTIEGHQERGEESYLVEIDAQGVVTATIRVDASAATWAAKLVSPAVIAFQHAAVNRYLGALARYARSVGEPLRDRPTELRRPDQ